MNPPLHDAKPGVVGGVKDVKLVAEPNECVAGGPRASKGEGGVVSGRPWNDLGGGVAGSGVRPAILGVLR